MEKSSTDSLAIRFSSDGELSPTLIRPRASLDSVSAPFLAEEAYPRILRALLDTHLDDGDIEQRICLSEENIARVASAASGALFGIGDDDELDFARFLVVPRVESAISVLLWRVRINSTCAPGQSGIELPSVPVHVLASSLAGLLDNTKLYASNKQGAFPPTAPRKFILFISLFFIRADLFTFGSIYFTQDTSLVPKSPSRVPLDHHHHLAPPTPLTARAYSESCLSPTTPTVARKVPPPRLSFSQPMTPPDSAVVETTPISASTNTPTTPTSRRTTTGLPRVKFRPPPIITRTTPSRPIPRLTQSAGAVTLTFAAAGLSGCEIEPLRYRANGPDQTNPTSVDVEKPVDNEEPPPPPRTPSPAPQTKKPPTRPPSPNPPRAPSPSKRVLRKAPPTPKSRPRSLVRAPSPTKQMSMWTPSPAEAHYRSSSPTKLVAPVPTRLGSTPSVAKLTPSPSLVGLTPPVRPKSMRNDSGSLGGSSSPALSAKLTDLPSSLASSPVLVPKTKLWPPRTPSPNPPSPAVEEAEPEQDVRSPSPPGSSLRSPSSNLLRSPSSSMFNASVGFGSPSGSLRDNNQAGSLESHTAGSSSGCPSTPTAAVRRTVSVSGVKFDVIESPIPVPVARRASLRVPGLSRNGSRSSSPGQPSTPVRRPSPNNNQDAGTVSPSPNAILRTRSSPGANTSLSTVPPLSPFPESDDDFEFGEKGKDKNQEDEDVTLTSRNRIGLGLAARVVDQAPSRASTRVEAPSRASTRVEAPSRASTSTPTRKLSPPPINTSSPSRNSKRSYTLGVPMTQLTSAGANLGLLSESEAESLAFPGASQSTLSLPGDISLPELVSPFITPIELSSSGAEGDGDGAEDKDRAPWRRRALPVPPVRSGSDPVVQRPIGLPTPQRPGLAVNPNPKQPLPSFGVPAHSRSGSSGPPTTHSRSGSLGLPTHSRSGSTGPPTHSRSGSEQIKLGGRESEMDLLVPFAITEALSRADVLRLMTKTGSVAGASSPPARRSVDGGRPIPVFMTPGSAPPGVVVGRVGRVRSPPSSSSESSSPSPLLSNPSAAAATAASSMDEEDEVDGEDEAFMVRTTEVGVGAGRARVQSGVGIGGGRARGGKKARTTDGSGLARSGSAATARPRVDSARTRTESFTRPRVDTITRARVDSTARPRVESATAARSRVDSAVRARVDSGLRRKSSANDSPVDPAVSVSRSPSTASARRAVRTPVGRKVSTSSMRKSSISSLRSSTATTTRTVPTTVSTKKTSVSSISGTSTPRSGTSTPRSRSMSMGRENVSGPATPKQGQSTPRPSMSTTPRTSMSSGRGVVSPRPSVTIPRTSPASPRSSPRTPVAPPSKVSTPKVPPARPQRSSLRPGPRSTTVSTSAPAVVTQSTGLASVSPELEPAPFTAPIASAPSLVAMSTSPPRTRATSLDTSPTKAHLGVEGPRPRRTTSVNTKPPPLSRSSVTTATLAPPPPPPLVRARASSRTTSSVGHEDGAVPFPIPESASESEGGLKVPETPHGPKRSLSVSSAARRLVNRARGANSPVPSLPTDAVSTSSIDKVQEKEKAPKSGRSLSRLAFSALLPKKSSSSSAAAEAKAALAQAKAREVAEAKAKAKAAAEEAKARAKAEAAEKAAAKEPRRVIKRFGSISRKTSVVG
ncbi:hypothetical protein FRC09_001055 [Ceratobasidium sp. 395]|nr:hypothetical protein FRC09_001055 [Ceratobasidium sp. 395]